MDTGTSNVHSLYSNARPLVENYNRGRSVPRYTVHTPVTPRLSVENLLIEDLLLVHEDGTLKAVVETGCSFGGTVGMGCGTYREL